MALWDHKIRHTERGVHQQRGAQVRIDKKRVQVRLPESTSSNQEEPTRVHIPERGTGSIPMRGTSSNRERGYGRKRGTGSNQEGPTRVHILERDTGSIPIRGTSSNRERGYGFDSPNTGSNQEGPTHPRADSYTHLTLPTIHPLYISQTPRITHTVHNFDRCTLPT